MIYVTGDTHGNFHRLSTKCFPQQKELTRDDYLIVCGDFGGVWNYNGETSQERHNLQRISDKPFTTLFVDGNHENFDRLTHDYPIVSFHGGKAHRIRDNIYHLMRGYVFHIDGKKIFTFGGAASHDIKDGILDPANYPTFKDLNRSYATYYMAGLQVRVKGISWWSQELPAWHERQRGLKNLAAVNNDVDIVISHCLPYSVERLLYRDCTPNRLTSYFDNLLECGLSFRRWYCGHYHMDRSLNDQYQILYHSIVQIDSSLHGTGGS